MMTQKLCLFIFLISLSLFPRIAEAQSIKGKIIDASNSDPLIGAVIKIQGTTLGTLSDLDGNYEINDITPGRYNLEFSYIGYNPKTLNDVLVTANKITDLDVALTGEGILTEEINVEASPTLANEQSLLIEQKNSSKIQDGISEQQIKRAPDAAASDVLKRVMGVNIVDNKFVFVRGISERYNNTTLNGVLAQSTESDRKSFSFDLFPAKLLENIIIAKSFTPDLPGNFSGGLVQMNTKDYVDQFTFGFETIGGFLSNTTSQGNFYTYNAGEKKILFFNSGVDDGGRSLPSNFPGTPFSGPNNYGKTLRNNWAHENIKAPLNGGFQLTLGNNFSLFNNPLGVLFSYTYRNAFDNNAVDRYVYNSDTTTLINYAGRVSEYVVLNGGILNINYKLGNNNKISIKNTYSLNSNNNTEYYEGINRIKSELEKRVYGTIFTERAIYTTQINGSSYIDGLSKLNITWNASYSEAERNEPDTKTTFYERVIGKETPFFTPLSVIPFPNVGQRFYSNLFDINRTASLNLENQFLKITKNQTSKIKYGVFAGGTSRNFNARLFAPINLGSFNISFQPIDSIFGPQNIDSSIISYVETTNKSDQYTANENIYAGYMMFDIPLNKLRIIAGLRLEYSEQKLNGFERTSQNPIEVSQKNNDLLPSINLTYALNEKTNIRASATQTVSRPELREIAPFGYIDFVTGGELAGNPELEQSLIQNYDLRYELFPGAGEIASVSLFYKHFNQPIEKVIVPTGSGAFIPSYTFENAINGAVNYGFELEIRKNLGFMSKYLRYVTFNSNFTLVNSKVDLEGINSGANETERRMQGQSPYILNLGLFYDNYDLGLSTNLLYNVFGEKISEVGRIGFYDVYEQGRDIIDFSVSKTFLNNFEGKFTIRDILDQDQVFTQDFLLNDTQVINKVVRRITTNTGYAITLSYKF